MTDDELGDELVRVQRALSVVHDPLAMLQSIFALAPFALQVYRADGRSLFVNRAFLELYGTEPPPEYNLLKDEVVAKAGITSLVQRAFAGETVHVPAMWYDPGDLEHVDVASKRVGQEVWMLPLLDADGRVGHIAIVAKDVTAEMHAKDAARRESDLRATAERARERVSRLQQVTSGLARASTPQDVARVILEEGVPALGARRCTLHVVTSDAQLELLASVGYADADTALMKTMSMASSSPSREAVLTGEPQWLRSGADIEARHPERFAQVRHLEVSNLACLPLATGGAPIGVLSIEFIDAARLMDDDDRTFALALARQAAQALDRARLFRAAHDAATRAEEASRAKDEFLSVLSHELRTPLNAIQGWAHLMATQRETDPTIVERGVDVILRSVKSQVTLVDDMLDMARIIRGKLRLALLDVDFGSVVDAVAESVAPTAMAKGVTITCDVPRGLVILGDADRLQQVVWNLLSNAIKFTPRGGKVTVAATGNADNVVLRVTDTGQGLAAGDIPYVFDRFRQVDSTSTRAKGGLGLGLAIVRHLVEAHAGHVRVTSDGVGRGATFEVELPISRVRPAAVPRESSSDPLLDMAPDSRGPVSVRHRALTGARVLAVDDEADAVELVSIVLEQAGAVVRTASSVAGALQVLESWTPDLVVSDIGMPGEDGFAFARKLRELGAPFADIPAIALTAFARREDADATLRAGFGWHLAKPVDPRVLTRVAAHALSTRPRD
jgi:signal transduction histidine kinase/ActR/RegA family two-component response regulator